MKIFSENAYHVGKIRGGWLTLNRSCNLRCKWCYAAGTEFDKGRNMDPFLAHQLIDVMGELGVKSIVLIGGEPTIYPYLYETVAYVRQKGILPMLISNGVRFSNMEFCKRLIDAGVKKITISLKGTTPNHYLELTKMNVFENVLQGIENLRSLDVEPSFEIVIVNEYLSNLEKVFSELTELRVKNITVDLASPVINQNEVSAPGVPNPLELRDAIHRIYHSVDPDQIDYVIYMTIPFCLLDPDVLQGLKDGDRLMSSCHVPHGNALIFDEHGGVLPCNHMESKAIGQWDKDFNSAKDFMLYWNSPELKNFRAACSCYPAEPCKTCSQWKECGGGCMVKWLYWNPADFIKKR